MKKKERKWKGKKGRVNEDQRVAYHWEEEEEVEEVKNNYTKPSNCFKYFLKKKMKKKKKKEKKDKNPSNIHLKAINQSIHEIQSFKKKTVFIRTRTHKELQDNKCQYNINWIDQGCQSGHHNNQ